jgi:predicted HicB family RNase H-like nuclease
MVMIMGKTSSAVKNKYNAKTYDRIEIVVPKGFKVELKEYAESKGESLNGFINRAINEALERERTT